MYKKIDSNNSIFNNSEFQKDKYKFNIILKNLSSPELELYSDEENYIICRGSKKYPTWIWTKDNFDKTKINEIEELITLYLTDNEIANVTDYIRGNYGPDYKFTHEDLQEKTKQEYGASDEEDMELVFAVAMEFAECQMCSINSMQKKFSLGFNRGQKIVEILEKMGVVSPKKGTQGRDVLMDTEQVKEVFHRK